MFRKRTLVVFSLLSVFFLLLLGQLINVQVVDHEYYWQRSQDTITEVEMLRPLRGKIKSRDGTVLGRNKHQFNLYVIPSYIDDTETLFHEISSLTDRSLASVKEEYNGILEKIDQYAEGAETKRLKKRRRRSARRSPHRLMRYLSFEEAAQIRTNRDTFEGTHVRGLPTRMYPEGKAAGHLTGYVAKLTRRKKIDGLSEYQWMKKNFYRKHLGEHLTESKLKRLEWRGSFLQGYIGRAGIEDQLDMYLRGKPGVQLIERDLLSGTSNEHRHIPPENGKDVRLTIDADWQNAAATAMEGISGAMVAIDPDTYEIRAMASSPGYDPNRLIAPVTMQAVEDILRNRSRPLLNRVIDGQYPPGSAFKLFVAAVGLKSGAISPSTTFNCSGKFTYGNNTWKCWIFDRTGSGHGSLTVDEALKHSCNVFFYKTGREIGGSRLKIWAKKFGFSKKTGIELPGEASGQLFARRDIINAAIGQGSLLVTPLQMVRMTAFVATGNPIKSPTILKKPAPEQASENLKISPGSLKTIRKGMFSVVNDQRGTAYRAESLRSDDISYNVAGKTSTAQVGGDKDPHGWFVGYAPYNNPRIAFVVINEHGKSGGGNAAPLIGEFLNNIDLLKKKKNEKKEKNNTNKNDSNPSETND